MPPAYRPAALAAALVLAASAAQARGTPAQRDACTPDALRLCQGTIPSVARTTACLVAHRAELEPSCRDVFAFAEPVAERTRLDRPDPARSRVARAPVARARRRIHYARRAVPYHIPRFNQAEAEAEVHEQYPYRTPYLPYWVFP